MSDYRSMRILVMFDLPVETKKERRDYSQFRKFLISDGYIMLQYSVYCRFCLNGFDVDKNIDRVKKNFHESGNIRILTVTENQFENMVLVAGSQREEEKLTDSMIVID